MFQQIGQLNTEPGLHVFSLHCETSDLESAGPQLGFREDPCKPNGRETELPTLLGLNGSTTDILTPIV